MKSLKEMTYRELKKFKEFWLNAKAFSICEVDRRGFQQTIRGIEKEMYRREVKPAVVVGVLVLIAIVCASCQTVKGVTGDAGWIFTKVSDNIVIEK